MTKEYTGFIEPPREENTLDRWRQRVSQLFNQSTYGGFEFNSSPLILASGFTLTAGNVESGTFANTQTINQVYHQIGENDGVGGGQQFDFYYSFTGVTGTQQTLRFVGRYQGSAGHNVLLYIYNFNTASWDRVTAAVDDFTTSTTDYELHFQLPESADYKSSNEVRIRIYHSSAGPVASHNFYTDYIALVQSSFDIDVAGDYYDVTGVQAYPTKGMTIDTTNGTVTIGKTGNYSVGVTSCFAGDVSTMTLGLFKNGTLLKVIWIRSLGDDTSIGSAAGRYCGKLEKDDVLKLAVTSDTSGVHISFYDLTFAVKQDYI